MAARVIDKVQVYDKPGAPVGGRVLWLQMELSHIKVIRDNYHIRFSINSRGKDCYFLKLRTGRGYTDRYDEYHIIRTSKKCFQLFYYDNPTGNTINDSFAKYRDVTDFIQENIDIKLHQERQHRYTLEECGENNILSAKLE